MPILAAPEAQSVDPTPSRHLIRVLRRQPDREEGDTTLPESVLWQAWCELRRRGESSADDHFLRSLRRLHRRRSLGSVELPQDDTHPDEHRGVDDPMLAELWKAYKRCICSQRTGPAAQLLNDIEAQLTGQ